MHAKLTRTAACAAAFALLVGGAAAPALAQQDESSSSQQESPAQADFSQDELESFAKASLEVDRLNQKWVDQIAQAESEEEGQEMRNQAVEEMSQAIRDEGLTVETYNNIFAAAENNPEVASLIKDYREQHR